MRVYRPRGDDHDRAIALALNKAIDWLLWALELLDKSYALTSQPLASLAPILRLHDDILCIIFELIAEKEPPSGERLGWFKLTHVCSAWKEVALMLPHLWARDVYVYGSDAAVAGNLLKRTEGVPVSVTARRLPVNPGLDKESSFDLKRIVMLRHKLSFIPLARLAHKGYLLDLSVGCHNELPLPVGFDERDLPRAAISMPSIEWLERILYCKTQPYLRSVCILLYWSDSILPADRKLQPMVLHPNLCHVDFFNSFIPCALPKLTNLRLACTNPTVDSSRMPTTWLDALLDTLQSSPALTDLRVIRYHLPTPSTPRRVSLPHLETLACTDVNLFELLELPALRCVHHVEGFGMPDGGIANFWTALSAWLVRYGLSPRSMQLSQVTCSPNPDAHHALAVRFGWHPWACPPSPANPLNYETFMHEEPAQYLSFVFRLSLRPGFNSHCLSRVFPALSLHVRQIPGTEALETLGFDNVMREHTFIRDEDDIILSPQPGETFIPLTLPSFPAVRTIELTLRDSDTLMHVLFSLRREETAYNLPQLSCLRIRGPHHLAADIFMSLRRNLGKLLRERAFAAGLASITTLKFELEVVDFPDSCNMWDVAEAMWKLNWAICETFYEYAELNDHATIVSEPKHEVDWRFDENTGRVYAFLLVTIDYHN